MMASDAETLRKLSQKLTTGEYTLEWAHPQSAITTLKYANNPLIVQPIKFEFHSVPAIVREQMLQCFDIRDTTFLSKTLLFKCNTKFPQNTELQILWNKFLDVIQGAKALMLMIYDYSIFEDMLCLKNDLPAIYHLTSVNPDFKDYFNFEIFIKAVCMEFCLYTTSEITNQNLNDIIKRYQLCIHNLKLLFQQAISELLKNKIPRFLFLDNMLKKSSDDLKYLSFHDCQQLLLFSMNAYISLITDQMNAMIISAELKQVYKNIIANLKIQLAEYGEFLQKFGSEGAYASSSLNINTSFAIYGYQIAIILDKVANNNGLVLDPKKPQISRAKQTRKFTDAEYIKLFKQLNYLTGKLSQNIKIIKEVQPQQHPIPQPRLSRSIRR